MIAFAVALLVFLIVALWNQPVYRTYTVWTDKLKKDIRIVQLSDLHSSSYGKNQSRLIDMIDKAKPDVIILTGDIVDDKVPEEGAYALIDGLVSKYPLYYVTGNHEYRHDSPSEVYRTLEKKGVHMMMDTYEVVSDLDENFIIAGTKDPDRNVFANEDDLIRESLLRTGLQESEAFVLLLSHRPEKCKIYGEFPIDLVLCGHAHGGQVRIPFLINGLFAPDQGFLPKYAGGQYQFDTYQMIVSRGLSFYIHLPRVFNPPEVVVIDLKVQKK